MGVRKQNWMVCQGHRVEGRWAGGVLGEPQATAHWPLSGLCLGWGRWEGGAGGSRSDFTSLLLELLG